jgi:hypothetical protein
MLMFLLNCLRSRIAKHALGGGAEGLDQPMIVDHDNGVGDDLEDAAHIRIALHIWATNAITVRARPHLRKPRCF